MLYKQLMKNFVRTNHEKKKNWYKFSNEFLRRKNKPVYLGRETCSLHARVLYNTYQETDNQCAYNRGRDTFDNKRHASSQQQS